MIEQYEGKQYLDSLKEYLELKLQSIDGGAPETIQPSEVWVLAAQPKPDKGIVLHSRKIT